MSSNKTSTLGPLLALFCGAIAISFAPIFVRVSEINPIGTAFWRVALSVPMLAIAWRGFHRPALQPESDRTLVSKYWLLKPGIFFACDLAFWHWSIEYTTVANATLLANFAFVFVSLVSWYLGEKLSWLFALGAILAVTGVTILLGADLGNRQYFVGNVLGIITAVFYASYILAVKRLRANFSTLEIMVWSSLTGAVILLPLTVLTENQFAPVSLNGWLVLLGLALVSHSGGQGFIAYALARLPASFSAVSLLTQPVMATLWAWLLLSEGLKLWQAVGGVLVLIGLILARKGNKQ